MTKRLIYMRSLLVLTLLVGLTKSSFADTTDYWTVRINGKTVINSNIGAILFGDPMEIELSTFNENDTVEVCYWTDHGSEREKWYYIVKDSNNTTIDTFTNSIDPILGAKQLRNNYIPFTVG